ncbi:transcription factor grauzone-like [Topomyia yanbarensis]|uniref:transcription factor grauzone-like n=1 Tax=Topomyia yanbarensis TaxID=2498891 RepID=UPI00273C8A21|nr:transcription factor grauzone-like [Topomyia yanbarensis]
MSGPGDGCLTCFKRADTDFLDVQSEKNKSVTVTLSKHFWFTEENFPGAIICTPCWEKVENFNRFYTSVEELYDRHIVQPMPVTVKIEPEMEIEYLAEDLQQEDTLPTHKSDMKNEAGNPRLNNVGDVASDVDLTDCESDDWNQSGSDESSEMEETAPPKRAKRPVKRKNVNTSKTEAKPKKVYAKHKPKTAEDRLKEDELIRQHVACTCDECGLTSETFTSFLKHSLEVHGKKSAFVLCCGRKYYKKILLFQHAQTVFFPETFRCEECRKNFTNDEGIKRHIKEFHATEEERKFKCDRCPKSFVVEHKYKKHMNDHYDWENKNCKCEHCGKYYKSRHILTNHIKLKHTEPTDFICDICAKGFHLRSQFLLHKIEHQNPTELKMQCEICLRWLKNRPNWRRHMQQHEQAEVTCDICGHVSPHQRALMGHKRRQHRGREYPCTLCPKTFRKPITLREHVAAVHTGDVLYSCTFCDKTFNSHANMHSHKKKMHPAEWWQERNEKYFTK